MQFSQDLVSGVLVKRYKRFLADVVLDSGEEITTSCANTGSMMGLCEPGSRVYLSISDNPKRKYKHTWEMVGFEQHGRTVLVGINTGHPNGLVAEAIEAGTIPELAGYSSLRREVKYGKNSRIDILLEDDGKPPCYVEVKNVTLLREKGLAEFPDARTERGEKHLREMADMTADGARAVMVYLAQRDDADRFGLAGDIDPHYLEAFRQAREAGVEALAYCCKLSPKDITVDRPLPIVMD